ncbi:MAG: BamA/TamA family outer membrane protein, partial [Saprospiraceae bacterium]|nr:BamA/TamA family outer membrane protein [Saprospiraceae bacterium]
VTDENSFYRLRKSFANFNPKLGFSFGDRNGLISFGPLVEYTKVENTPERFISSKDLVLPDNAFEGQVFGGLQAEFEFENVENQTHPKGGLRVHGLWNLKRQFADELNSQNLRGEFTVYFSLDRKKHVTIASRVGAELLTGDYQLFQAATLGGTTNMRGLRADRFSGKSLFFHNTDLRIRIVSVENPIVPFTLGIHGGFDYGRVQLDQAGEDNTFHTSAGGGLWISPLDFLLISGDYFVSDDDKLVGVRLGFFF